MAFKGVVGEVESFKEGARDAILDVAVGLRNLFYCRLAIDEFELGDAGCVNLGRVKVEP